MLRASRLFLSLALAGGFVRPASAAAPDAPASALPAKRAAGPDAALAGSLDAPAKVSQREGPALEFEAFRYAVEGQVSGKRKEELADLEKLIALGGSEQELPAWLFRLGELHWEEGQYLFFEANRKDDELARLRPGDPRAARLRAEKAALERRSKAEQEQAIRRYREVITRFPRWERLDEVVFFLGENLWKQQRRKEALTAYRALITRYPSSRFVPDAWIAYGEYFFDAAEREGREANLRKALEAYRHAAASPGSDVGGFALYKQAWVHYNLGEWERALDLFARVVAGSAGAGGGAPDRRLALAREARKDYVRTYMHVGAPKEAPERFARVGGAEHARAMTKGLADLYWESGKDREAILVYHRLVGDDPAAADAPLFQSRIVTAAGRLGKRDLVVLQAQRFPAILKAAAGAKGSGTEDGKRALEAARAEAENTLRTLAVQYHAEWRKTRDPRTATFAEGLYREYVGLFPEARHARELRFFHAELLFALGRWQEAGDEYTAVAKAGAAQATGEDGRPLKYQVEALESAVLAYAEVAKQGAPPPAHHSADGAPAPMPPAQRQLVDACERYLALAPRGEKNVEIAYQAAQAYYAHDQLPEAERLFTGIAVDHPRHELARFSANLALDTLNLRRDWRGMHALARRFWDTPELLQAHPELRDDLARVVEQSAFKLVEELQRAGRLPAAAEAYVAFATEWPQSKLAPTALHNAAVSLAEAHATARAIEVREQLAQRYPSHPLAAKALAANAQDWAATLDFDRAAEAWERYHAEWRKQRTARKAAGGPEYEEQVARDGLFDAGVLREGLGQLRRAEQDRLAFLASWPEAREAPQVFLSLADLAAREGNSAKEARLLREYQKKHARSADDWLAAQHRIARGAERRGDAAGARRAWAEALAYARGKKVGERGMPAVAQARLLALDADFRAYDRLALGGDGRRLDAQVKEKARKLEALRHAYTEVVNLKVPEPAVCALERVGQAYQHFAKALLAAPVPRGLRKEPRLVEEYRKQLASFAEAPEKKGLEGLELAVAKARELGVENRCARDAAAALAQARPEEVPLERLPPWDEAVPADPEAAWRDARAALLRDPADRKALVAAAQAALARGKPGVARLVVQRAEKLAPGDLELAVVAGRARLAEGDRAAARADLLAAAQRGSVPARRDLLRAALAARDWTGAAEHAKALEQQEPQDARAALARGIAERHAGHVDEALAAYDRAERLAGDALPAVHLARAVALARAKGQCDAALAELRRYERLAGPEELDAAAASTLERECASKAARTASAKPSTQAVPAIGPVLGETPAEPRPSGAAPAPSPLPSR